MIKDFLTNLTLKRKMSVLTITTLLVLTVIAFTVVYFFNTFKVLNMLINAERIHMSYFQKGVSGFYRWQLQPDSGQPEEAIAMVDTANNMAFVFGRLDSIAQTNKRDEFENILYNTLSQALLYNRANARMMAERCLLFIKINDKRFIQVMQTAYSGAQTGYEISRVMHEMKNNNHPQLEHKLESLIYKIEGEYEQFAADLDVLGAYVQRILLIVMIGLVVLLAMVIYVISVAIAKAISVPMKLMVNEFGKMAEGEIGEPVGYESKDETGQLVASFNKLQLNLTEVIKNAKEVALGNYDHHIQPKSSKDELGIALRKMTEALLTNQQKQHELDWLKTGKTKMADVLRGDQSLESIAGKTLQELCSYLQMEWASFYVWDDDSKQLKLMACFGTTNEMLTANIKPGQLLTGQSWEMKKPIWLSPLSNPEVIVSSSIIRMKAESLAIVPLMHEAQAWGIIELAGCRPLYENDKNLLLDISETIAIAIRSANARTKVKALLDKTLNQAEELQSQQEELRVINEELSEQAEALRESEKLLQQQQEELRVTNEELEERTHDLELQKNAIDQKNKELEKAAENISLKANELEAISRYKSEFLANMSHELRTPLNSLLILSRDMAENKKQNLTTDQVQSASIIYQSGQDLLNLINDILDLSKIESGKMTITPEVVSLDEFCQYIVNTFKHMTEIKGLQFSTVIHPDLPAQIVTDRHRLAQIIKNLVSNAIKFTHKGGVKVSFEAPVAIELKNQNLSAHNSIAIVVEDSGIGIAPEKQHEIFEAFQQADGSISRKYGGTGLGLSITRELVKLLGGEIILVSDTNKGSKFTIVLPLSYVPLDEVNLPSSEKETIVEKKQTTVNVISNQATLSAAEDSEQPYLEDDRQKINQLSKVLLIVEDDSRFAQILINEGRKRGFKCIAAQTAEAAWKLLSEYKPDAILLDIILPGMNGYSLLEMLKEDPQRRHIPVHIVSGTDGSLEALQRGAIGYLHKPVQAEALDQTFQKIEAFVQKHIKDLLVVEDDHHMRQLITKVIGGGDINITEARSASEAKEMLNQKDFDCMVLDLGLPDMSGFELLKQLQNEKRDNLPPVIVYTGRELSREENTELRKYASSIIIKGVKSEERLLDETALFLHRVVDKLPESKKEIINVLYDKEAVFKNKTILVVDDDMRNVFALTRVLEDHGMTVIEAENGIVALEKIKKHPEIDLILMDIMMPEMDGYTAIRAIRKMPDRHKLPILTLTAKAMKEDRQKSLEAGANDYMTKPVDISKLLSLLRVWLHY